MLEPLKKVIIEKSQRILYFLFLLLIPASIFRVNASITGFESFFLFRVMLFLILTMLVLTFIFKKTVVLERLNNLKKEKYVIRLFIVWLLASAISYFWILDFEKYFRYNVLLAISILFVFTIIFFVQNKKTLEGVWKLLLLTFSAAITIALMEIFFEFRLPGSALLKGSRSLQLFVTSFFNHPNDFASYISLSLPFLILLPLYKGYSKYRWWVFIAVTISAFVLTFTGSKLNYIATIIGLLLALLILTREQVKQLSAYLAIFVLAFFALVPASGPVIGAKVLELFSKPVDETAYTSITEGVKLEGVGSELSGGYGSATIRKNLIINGFHTIRENPKLYVGFFAGVGAGQVEVYMAQFQDTEGTANLHNWWLEVFVNHGIFIV